MPAMLRAVGMAAALLSVSFGVTTLGWGRDSCVPWWCQAQH